MENEDHSLPVPTMTRRWTHYGPLKSKDNMVEEGAAAAKEEDDEGVRANKEDEDIRTEVGRSRRTSNEDYRRRDLRTFVCPTL